MAKLSSINKNNRRIKLSDKFYKKREKLKKIVSEKLNEFFHQTSNQSLVKNFKSNIEKALDSKLSELKPEDIKTIVEKMIREHLGWLIVWGGVFGGFFGLIFSLIQTYLI